MKNLWFLSEATGLTVPEGKLCDHICSFVITGDYTYHPYIYNIYIYTHIYTHTYICIYGGRERRLKAKIFLIKIKL